VTDKAVPYEFIPNLDQEQELLFRCTVCGEETYASVLRTHAVREHNTTLYVTNMTTVKDDRRFTVRR
jgi:hypothetical protein